MSNINIEKKTETLTPAEAYIREVFGDVEYARIPPEINEYIRAVLRGDNPPPLKLGKPVRHIGSQTQPEFSPTPGTISAKEFAEKNEQEIQKNLKRYPYNQD